MNTLYKIAHLLDGDFDGKQIHFNKRRYYLNYLVEYVNYFFFLSHMYISIYHEHRYDLVYYKVQDGVGARISNFTIGWTIFTYALVMRVYRRFTKHPECLQTASFLWCFNETEMQERHFLDQQAARKQIRAQHKGERYAFIWHRYFFVSIAGYMVKFAVENPTIRIEYGVWFFLKLVLCFALFYIQQSGLLRIFLTLDEMNLSCFYLANYLNTLMRKLQSVTDLPVKQRILSNQIREALSHYNRIIRMQRQLNGHFEQTFLIYFTFCIFTVLYPIAILFETDPAMIVSNTLNYLMIVFIIFFPSIHFNSKYLIASVCAFGFQ